MAGTVDRGGGDVGTVVGRVGPQLHSPPLPVPANLAVPVSAVAMSSATASGPLRNHTCGDELPSNVISPLTFQCPF
jgi:hypothetical protein